MSAGSWREVGLFDLVTIASGQVDPRLPEYRDLPLIAPDHIESGTGRLLEVRTASQQKAISGKYLVEPGDVIYSKIRPYLQKAHRATFRALCSADMYPLRPRAGIDGDFILNLLLSEPFTNFAVSTSTRSGIPKINRVELAQFRTTVPSADEQHRIGGFLNSADRLIKSLELFIAKKRAVKQGLMQELLTGSSRLPGFTERWSEKVPLASAVTRSSGYWGLEPGNGEVNGRVIRAGDVGADHRIHSYAVRGLLTSQAIRSRCEPGDVILTASGTIGNVALISEGEFFASNFVRVLRPRTGLLGAYLYYALQTSAARSAMDANLGLSAMPNLGAGFYREPWLALPPEREQAAIAGVLQDADTEIAALKRRLEAARAIRQGMMQELLTGRTRLVAEGIAA